MGKIIVILISIIFLFFLIDSVQSSCDISCSPGTYFIDCLSGCGTCPVGHYCDGSVHPIPCPPGTERTTTGATADTDCAPCSSGFIALSNGTSSCEECPLGYKCPDATSRILCSSGEYTTSTQSTSCSLCPSGMFCPHPSASYDCEQGSFSSGSATVCEACLEGYYQTLTGQSSCNQCPAGSKCPLKDELPQVCPRGTYSSEGEIQCHVCPSGTYTSSTDTKYSCESCSTGNYCPSANEDPIPCPVGFYNNGLNLTECLPCPNGEYTSSAGSTSCLPCEVGYQCVDGVKTSCPEGTYSSSSSSTCLPCPSGHECPDPTLAPSSCAVGTYSVGGFVTSCTSCDDGYYANSTGLSECAQCPSGHDCSDKTASPVICEAGEYSPYFHSPCLPCPSGTYTDQQGSVGCADCEPGSMCPSGDASIPCAASNISRGGKQVECESCPIGFYPSTDHCIACSLGKYCPDGVNELACSSGTYSAVRGNWNCTICPSGFSCATLVDPPVPCGSSEYSDEGQTSCTPCVGSCSGESDTECAWNEYSSSGDGICYLCPAGKRCPDKTSVPVSCVSGEYSRLGEIACTTCPAGYACPLTTIEPVLCVPGFWSSSGSISCTPCEPGQFCNESGLSEPSYCSAGWYSIQYASTECTECSAGFACNDTSVQYTEICKDGFYSYRGDTHCRECPPGFACPNPSGSDPIPCDRGTYSLGLQEVCYDCPRGYFCESDNITECNPGQYSFEKETLCHECPAGHYCPTTDVEPIKCPRGFWSNESQITCFDCQLGYYCPMGSNRSDPYICPNGYYCPLNTILPIKCPAGQIGAGEGLTDVSQCGGCPRGYHCPAGTFEILESLLCPAGYYCPENTTYATEFPCLAGYHNPLIGQWNETAACLDCPEGYYCYEGTDYYQLNRCPPGYYCPKNTDSFHANPCPAGTFSSKELLYDVSQCDECPKGHSCAAASTNPTPCTYGTYKADTGAGNCVACPAGTNCPYVGMDTPEPCKVGHYCTSGTSDGGTPCLSGSYTNERNAQTFGDCFTCWEGYACYSGTGGIFKQPVPCSAGYYCEGVPQPGDSGGTTYPYSTYGPGTADPAHVLNCCPSGTYSNKTRLKRESECTTCDPGYYCVGCLTSPSGLCDPGYYCPEGSDSAQQVACPAGTYSNVYGISDVRECSPCIPGHYCPISSTHPSACVAGTYYSDYNAESAGPTSDVNAKECIRCPAGYKCQEAQVDPEECGRGYYSAQSSSACSVCELGRYCPDNATTETNMNTIYVCDGGTFCPTGMTHAPDLFHNSCPVGKYCPSGTTSIVDCPAGTYSNVPGLTDSSECTECPKGFYCEGGLSSVSGPCDEGHYCPAGSSVSNQYVCPEGTYRDRTSGDSLEACSVCPNGFYCENSTSSPIDCPRGYYCDIGCYEPQACPAGTFGNSTNLKGVEFCSDCPAGQYCLGGMEPSGLCDAGYFCSGGSSTPTPVDGLCPTGGYCETGSTFPSSCASGTYNNETGGKSQADCIQCPGGYYCSGSNNPYPTDECWEGFYCTGGASNPIQYQCTPGHYCPTGSATPLDCEPGSYNLEYNQSVCVLCPEGYYCPNYQMEEFESFPCPIGQYCAEGTAVPDDCPISTFSNTTKLRNFTECNDCLPGSFCDALGLVEPSGLCDAGFYCLAGSIESNPVGKSYGDVCPTGYYCPIGTYDPEPCPSGTYLPTTGNSQMSDCVPCDAGSYCQETGLSSVTGPCEGGYFCNNGSESQYPIDGVYGNVCPKGFYCPQGTWIPIPCPEGEYSSETGKSSCDVCPAGYFCNSSTVDPFICPVGHYCPSGTGISQPECPSGSFSNVEGLESMDQCQLCSGGDVCSVSGLISPDDVCKAGIYCLEGAMDTDGNVGVLGGFSATCVSGHYCPQGSAVPVTCPIGTFSPNTGNQDIDDCDSCSPSKYCDQPGLSSPVGNCDEGFFCSLGAVVSAPTDGNITGDICPVGHFCVSGSSSPTICPEGTFSSLEGQSECKECIAGYYCPEGTDIPLECLEGYYCPSGTNTTLFPCPKGSFSNATMLPSKDRCQLCSGGTICSVEGLSEPDGSCPSGFYCLDGAISGGVVGELGGESNTCPSGHYCPIGTTTPIPCFPGTFLNETGKSDISSCEYCPKNNYCETPGLSYPSGICDDGYYCSFGAVTSTPLDGNVTGDICPQGHFCQNGTIFVCEGGTYSKETGKVVCDACPKGFYCDVGTITPSVCPQGKYCPPSMSTSLPDCPSGSYNSLTGLYELSQCKLCSGGLVCENPGLTLPDEVCAEGYFCTTGAAYTNGSVGILGGNGGICPVGYYCPTQTSSPFPCPIGTFSDVEGIGSISECKNCTQGMYCDAIALSSPTGNCTTGYYCPLGQYSSVAYACSKGHYCVEGSAAPIPCEDGTYSDQEGLSACKTCPLGYYCEDSCEDPVICPIGSFCDDGFAHFCPNGTYGTDQGLQRSDECLDCPAGRYCSLGQNAGDCDAGHICYFGNEVPNPELNSRKGDLCPIGHYCPEGTTVPIPCVNSVSSSKGGENISSCHDCGIGFYCIEGSVIEYPCPMGYYCDQNLTGLGVDPIPCPNGTYNPNTQASNITDCIPCEEGYYCPEEHMATCKRRECTCGHYCPEGSSSPIPCPSGTYRNETGATTNDTCLTCPSGYYCPEGSVSYIECSEGMYCPPGSSIELICPAGYYCLKRTGYPVDCPAGYYCPEGNSFPILCTGSVYCDEHSSEPTPCPDGYTGNNATEFKDSLEASCLTCRPGTYSSLEDGLSCLNCSAGYVCLEGATRFKPTNITSERGYICPKGYYCPNGTGSPFACSEGTYASTKGMSFCLNCPKDSYQNLPGKDFCKVCGSSSFSSVGSSVCECNGTNRVFQPSDGSCVCKEGYIFYSGSEDSSLVDDTTSCSKIVYDRCGNKKFRNYLGECVDDEEFCKNACEEDGDLVDGRFDYDLGICICDGSIENEDEICDKTCRVNQLRVFFNSEESAFQIYDPQNETIIRSFDVTSISAGSIYCEEGSTCDMKVISVSTSGFLGVYNPNSEYLVSLFNESVQSTLLDEDVEDEIELRRSTFRRTTSLSSNLLSNPVVCLEAGSGLIWDLSTSGGDYPVYIRDSLLNNEGDNFDYGHLRKLEKYISNNMTMNTFGITFDSPGVFVFGMNSDKTKIMIVRVMNEEEQCDEEATFKPISSQSLVSLGISKVSETDIILNPDWVLVISLCVGFCGFVVVLIGAIHFFRTSTFIFSMAGARPKLPFRYQKLVKLELSKKGDSVIFGTEGVIDLDGFDVPLFYEKMKSHREKMERVLSDYEKELKVRYGQIVEETNLIKDMIVKRPDSGMVVLLNVNKRIDNLRRHLSDVEHSDDLYDEKSMKQLFEELELSLKEMKNEDSADSESKQAQLKSILGEKELKKYEDLKEKEEKLKTMTEQQYDHLVGRLNDIKEKMEKAHEEKKPRIIRSELLSHFSELMNKATRDLGKKMNGMNLLRMKMNEITNQEDQMNVSMNIAKLLNTFLTDILEDLFKKYGIFKEDEEWEWWQDEEDEEDNIGRDDEDDFEGDWDDPSLDSTERIKTSKDRIKKFRRDVRKMKSIMTIQHTRELHDLKEEMKKEQEKEKETLISRIDRIHEHQMGVLQDRIQDKMDDDELDEEEKRTMLNRMRKELEWFDESMKKEKETQLKQFDRLFREKMEKKKKLLLKRQKNDQQQLNDKIIQERDYNKQLKLSEMEEKEFEDKYQKNDSISDEEKKKLKAEKLLQRKLLIEKQIKKRKEMDEIKKNENDTFLNEMKENEENLNETIEKQVNENIKNSMKRLYQTKKKILNEYEDINEEEKKDLLDEHKKDLEELESFMSDEMNKANQELQKRIKERMERMQLKKEEKERSEKERDLIIQGNDIENLKELVNELKESQNTKEVKIEKLQNVIEKENLRFEIEKMKEEEEMKKEVSEFVEEKKREIEETNEHLDEEKNKEIDKLRKIVEEKIQSEGISEEKKKKLIFEFNQHTKQFEESYNLQKREQEERIQLLIEKKKKRHEELLRKQQEQKELEILKEQEVKLNALMKEKDSTTKNNGHYKSSKNEEEEEEEEEDDDDDDDDDDENEGEIVNIKEEDELEIHEMQEHHKDDMERVKQELMEKEKRVIDEFNKNLSSELEKNKAKFDKIKRQKAVTLKKEVEDQLQNATTKKEKQEILGNFRKQLNSLNHQIKEEQNDYKKQLQQRILMKKQKMFEENLKAIQEIRSKQAEEEELLRQSRQYEEEKNLLIERLKSKQYQTVEEGIEKVVLPRQNLELDELNADEKEEKKKALIGGTQPPPSPVRNLIVHGGFQKPKNMYEVQKDFLKKRVKMKQRHLNEQLKLKTELQKYEQLLKKDENFQKKIEDELTSFTKVLESEREKMKQKILEEKEKEKQKITDKLDKKMKKFREVNKDKMNDVDLLKEEKMIEGVINQKKGELEEKLSKKLKTQREHERILQVQEEEMKKMKEHFQNEYVRQMNFLEMRIKEKNEIKKMQIRDLKRKAEKNVTVDLKMEKPTWDNFTRKFFGVQRAKNRFMNRLIKVLESSEKFRNKNPQKRIMNDESERKGAVRGRTNSMTLRRKNYREEIFQFIGGIEFILSGSHLRPYQELTKLMISEATTEEDKAFWNELSTHRKELFTFGNEIISLLAERFSFVAFKMKMAKTIGPTPYKRNAFKNLFEWNPQKKTLFVHSDVLANHNPGRFVLLVIHCSAHIYIPGNEIFDDLQWKFVRSFYRMLRYIYNIKFSEFYKEKEEEEEEGED